MGERLAQIISAAVVLAGLYVGYQLIMAGKDLQGFGTILTPIVGVAAGMVSGFLATLLLVLFFLASGDHVRQRLMKRATSSPLARWVR